MENNIYNTKFSDDMFEKAIDNVQVKEDFSRPSISFLKDVTTRLFRNKLAVVSIIFIAIICILTIIWPFITTYSESYNTYLNNLQSANAPTPYYAFQDYAALNLGFFEGGHLFGTDDMGRDLFARAMQGGRVSLTIGFVAAFINLIVGVTYGSIAGFVGGRTDNIMMRFSEVLYSIPYMLMVILFATILGSGMGSLIIAMSITGWVPTARLVRGQTLRLKEEEYVNAAKSFGAESKWILLKHIVPNTMGPIIVGLTLSVPVAIFSEATLSFLGLGIQPPNPSWGQMANDAISQMMVGNINTILVPCLLISLTMLSFNLLGDGLNDALDPKQRK